MKIQKTPFDNTIEMFIFANFNKKSKLSVALAEFYLYELPLLQVLGECYFKAAKVPFEWSQFQKVGVALSKYYLLVLCSLRVLGESCFKAAKAPFERSQFQKMGVALSEFVLIASIRGKLF